jgi:hypothetical protein
VARPERFELPTFWFVGIREREALCFHAHATDCILLRLGVSISCEITHKHAKSGGLEPPEVISG